MRSKSVLTVTCPLGATYSKKGQRISKMNSVTRWMLVAALIGANGNANARVQAYDHDSVAGETNCRPPFVCERGVKAHFKGYTPNGTHPPKVSGSHGAPGKPPAGEDDHSPGPVGPTQDKGHPPGGTFACGEVVNGYTVTCKTGPTAPRIAAPEIDTSLAVTGAMFAMGCLAILYGRRRHFPDNPGVLN